MSTNISENNKRIIKNTLYMYIRMFISLIVSLFTTRIVFNTLGFENYGIYNIVGSIIVLFTFINNGLQGATRRYILAELATGNILSQRKIFTLSIKSHVLISLIIFIIGESIGLYILNYILNIPQDRMLAANVVYQLSIFTCIISIMQSPYQSAIIAYEKMSIYAYLSIFDVIAKLVIMYFVYVINFDKLIIYGISIFVVTTLIFLIHLFYCKYTFPMCKYVKTNDNKELRSMYSYMGWALFGQASNIASQQGVSMLVNIFYNVTVNAAIGISDNITRIITQFISNFQIAFNPQITKLYIQQDFNNLNVLLFRGCRYSCYLVLVFFVPICFDIHDLLTIWLGKYPQYTAEFCILTLACMFLYASSNPLVTAITSDKNISLYQVLVTLTYLGDFLLCWVFLYAKCIPYVVLIIKFIMDIILVAIRLYITKKRIPSFPILSWVYQLIINPICILIPPIIISNIFVYITINNIYIRFITIGIVSFLVTIFSIFIIGLNNREKELILSKIKRIKLW